MFEQYFQAVREQLPADSFAELFNPPQDLCLAIKSHSEGYVYANKNFFTLMGFTELNSLIHKKDTDLYSDQALISLYKQDDEKVYDTGKPQEIYGEVKPERHPQLVKTMQGISYPLILSKDHTKAVFLMHRPVNGLINLSFNTMFEIPSRDLARLLTRRSYNVGTFNISRMELLCFAELIKGKHAGEIAQALNIKQLTVESYLSNLKNKCGVSTKSEIIDFFMEHRLLEKVVV